MSTLNSTASGETSRPPSPGLPFGACWEELKQRRRFIAAVTLCGLLLATIIAFLIPAEYESSATLMPPEQQALSTTSALNVLTGQLPSLSAGGGLLNQRTAGATSIGILQSRTIQDEIVKRFDLRQVYEVKVFQDARLELTRRTHLEEDRKNGLINIVVTDRDKYRARDIARAYIEDLNRLLSTVSTSSARREREFLQTRVAAVNSTLGESTRALGQFSSRNATLDPQKQAVATLEVAGRLQADLAAAEAELASLQTVYTNENVQVRTASARVGQLRDQLQKITGQGQATDSSDLSTSDPFPSVRKLPMLGAAYGDLARQVAVQEALYTTLQKQYELARVQEAKEIPAVKVLDVPDVAERKSSPHRGTIVGIGAVLSALFASVWVLYRYFRRSQLRLIFGREENTVNVLVAHS